MSSEEIQRHTAGENEGVLEGEREFKRGREEDRSPKQRERGSCFAFEEARNQIAVSCKTTQREMLEKQSSIPPLHQLIYLCAGVVVLPRGIKTSELVAHWNPTMINNQIN